MKRIAQLISDPSTEWWEYALCHVTGVRNRIHCSAPSSHHPIPSVVREKPGHNHDEGVQLHGHLPCCSLGMSRMGHTMTMRSACWHGSLHERVVVSRSSHSRTSCYQVANSNNAVFRGHLTLSRRQFRRKHRLGILDLPIDIPHQLS